MDMSDVSDKINEVLAQIDALPKYVLYGSLLILVGVIFIIVGLFLL